MSLPKLVSRAVVGAGAALLLALPSGAWADHVSVKQSPTDRSAYTVDTSLKGSAAAVLADDSTFSAGHQHGGVGGHLPGKAENVQKVGSLEPTFPFGAIDEGQIADVAVYKNAAYLNSWSEPTCSKGGVYTADITNLAKPRQLGFVPALPGNYHGEGAHVISASTSSFSGDLLAVNNEFCTDTPTTGGGFDLYDVSDPASPKILVQGFGDRGKEGVMNGSDALANEYHSVFMWTDDGKVYLVGVDNEELHDVDIYDISDPRSPKPIKEFDLTAEFPSIRDQSANGDLILHHDMVVKEIGGVQTMSSSYWDAGYVVLDVENPARPKLLRDSSFDAPDTLVTDPRTGKGFDPPEGNAHQSEFSYDDQYLLAADEDFSPYRAGKFTINDTEYPAQEVGGGASAATLPDKTLNGPTTYGGYGCPASKPVPKRTVVNPTLAAGEEAILVLQRGPSGDPENPEEACFPGEKADMAKKAGWDAVLLVNRHLGSATADEAYCGSGGYPPGEPIVTLCTTHAGLHDMFNKLPAQYTTPYSALEGPVIGASGGKVRGESVFDGWGYAHLYRNAGTKMAEVGAYAIPESLSEAYASGFGDLSIHEFAADPETNLGYIAYYSGGVRVVKFDETGMKEVGAYVDSQGSNVWGIEQFTRKGKRYFAGSDRDHGLSIFRYTGPGSP